MSYAADRAFSDDYRPELEAVLKYCAADLLAITDATKTQDRQQATDLVLTTTVGTIAARVRRPGYWQRDLTLRLHRRVHGRWQRGFEADKIIAGFADLYIYAWTHDV
jgi:hypothetical protein